MAEAVCGNSSRMDELETKRGSVEPGSEPPSGPEFAAATQDSYARTLFFGSDGLRPGWGLAFYVAVFYPFERLAARLAWSRDFGASGLWSELLEEFGWLLAAIAPSMMLAKIENRPWKLYGLPPRQALGKLFWVGSLWGFAAISVLMFALYGLHVFRFGHLALHGGRILRFAVFWGVMFLLVGLFEEFLLRGYAQFTLARGTGFWWAALVLSCTFGLIHIPNNGEDWSGLLGAAIIGFFFCLTLRRTGNLWFAVGFHAAWDWGETFFYSVPDSGMVAPGHLFSSSLQGTKWLSGGMVGPEGSLLCLGLIALVWVAFDRAYPRAAA
jgi:uncharacterized protein